MLQCDFHIHTKYLGCANGTMEVPAIVAECERVGCTDIMITDHLNSLDRLPDHVPIRKDIAGLDPAINVFFGVELNFLGCDGDLPVSEEIKEQAGFQFTIGGIHGAYIQQYDIEQLVAVQHRHHLLVCANPLVDMLVHPYWFRRGGFNNKGWPWFDTMKAVPDSLARELGQASAETGTAIEINACAIFAGDGYSERFKAEYVDYLAVVADAGATFSLGSDAHDISHLGNIAMVWDIAERLGLSEQQIWRPDTGPLVGPDARA